jgi:hypothetical protein
MVLWHIGCSLSISAESAWRCRLDDEGSGPGRCTTTTTTPNENDSLPPTVAAKDSDPGRRFYESLRASFPDKLDCPPSGSKVVLGPNMTQTSSSVGFTEYASVGVLREDGVHLYGNGVVVQMSPGGALFVVVRLFKLNFLNGNRPHVFARCLDEKGEVMNASRASGPETYTIRRIEGGRSGARPIVRGVLSMTASKVLQGMSDMPDITAWCISRDRVEIDVAVDSDPEEDSTKRRRSKRAVTPAKVPYGVTNCSPGGGKGEEDSEATDEEEAKAPARRRGTGCSCKCYCKGRCKTTCKRIKHTRGRCKMKCAAMECACRCNGYCKCDANSCKPCPTPPGVKNEPKKKVQKSKARRKGKHSAANTGGGGNGVEVQAITTTTTLAATAITTGTAATTLAATAATTAATTAGAVIFAANQLAAQWGGLQEVVTGVNSVKADKEERALIAKRKQELADLDHQIKMEEGKQRLQRLKRPRVELD